MAFNYARCKIATLSETMTSMQVVFLRGVNVGGRRVFRPAMLAKELENFDVVNIGAAGTFVVRRPVSQRLLRAELFRRLPFQAEILICTAREMLNAVSANPFDGQPAGPEIVRFASVLANNASVPPELPLNLPGDDWIVRLLAIRGRFAFGLYRRRMSAVSYLSRFERRLGVPMTTRNWNTIASIIKVLSR